MHKAYTHRLTTNILHNVRVMLAVDLLKMK